MKSDRVGKQINNALDLADKVLEEDKEIQKQVPAAKPKRPMNLRESLYDDDLMDDYRETRDTLKSLITKAELALDTLLNVANQSEHPRAFEVVSTLVKTISDVSERLMNLQKTIRELEQMKKEENDEESGDKSTRKDSSGNTYNQLFVGSTKDLLRMMAEEEKEMNRDFIEGESKKDE